MDYEFKKNTLDGQYYALFSMGHEALGRWLVEEVNQDFDKISAILLAIPTISQKVNGVRWLGHELTLVLQGDEALVQANHLFSDSDDELEADLHLYEDESVALCGLDDFEQVLLAWKSFIERF
jgi:hypothetical protein